MTVKHLDILFYFLREGPLAENLFPLSAKKKHATPLPRLVDIARLFETKGGCRLVKNLTC